jgi:hypothetical protein
MRRVLGGTENMLRHSKHNASIQILNEGGALRKYAKKVKIRRKQARERECRCVLLQHAAPARVAGRVTNRPTTL